MTTDAQTETSYLGDSVYIALLTKEPPIFELFLNNGERDNPTFITRKSSIVLEPEVAERLVEYIKAHS